MLSEPKIYSWILGDWSGDGHGWTSTILVRTTLETNEFYKYNDEIGKEFGWDFRETGKADCISLLREYAKPYLTIGQLKCLKEHGFQFKDEYNRNHMENELSTNKYDDDLADDLWIGVYEYTEIIVFCFKYVLPKDAVFSIVEYDNVPLTCGYGIFQI